MSPRAKALTIVAILWVAAVGVITWAFYASRTEDGFDSSNLTRCMDSGSSFYECTQPPGTRTFDTDGWLAYAGIATLVAVVAALIIFITMSNRRAQVS